MRTLPAGPFHAALNLEIANAPEDVAAWFESCLAAAREVEPVRAVYVELNGFDFSAGFGARTDYVSRELVAALAAVNPWKVRFLDPAGHYNVVRFDGHDSDWEH